MHQPTAWPLPHAYVQPNHAGSGSYGQLLRPYWSSAAWDSRRSVNGGNQCFFDILAVQGVRCDAPGP